MGHRGALVRVLRGIAGAFSGATIGWVALAALTPGDFLEATDPRRLAAVALATGAGAFLSLRVHGRRGRVAVYVVTALSFLFWAAVPAGWWATLPPAPAPRADGAIGP